MPHLVFRPEDGYRVSLQYLQNGTMVNYASNQRLNCKGGFEFIRRQRNALIELKHKDTSLARHRRLALITDATQSVISGNGTAAIEAFKTYRVTVTAKDCTGLSLVSAETNSSLRFTTSAQPGQTSLETRLSGRDKCGAR